MERTQPTPRSEPVTTTVPTQHIEDLLAALRAAGHHAEDTGERVTTEQGLSGEAVIAVTFGKLG